jgi:hypothetical protein
MKASEAVAKASEKVFGKNPDPNAQVTPEQKAEFEAEVERLKALPDESASDVVMSRAVALRLQAQAEAEEREALEIVAQDVFRREGWTFDVSDMSLEDLRAVAEPKSPEEDDYEANRQAAESRVERGVTPAPDNETFMQNTDNERNQ